MKNETAVLGVKKGRNVLQTTKRRKASWIDHILRGNCLIKYVITGNKGRIKVMRRRRRRRKQ